MNKSDLINELAAALSGFQGEVVDVYKEKKGYGYNYADLSGVLYIVRPLLKRHNLAVTQLCGEREGKITLETVLMHKSGQWISETLAFDIPDSMTKDGKQKNSKAQNAGGIITYMRRYALAAITGIAQTDDDAALPQEEEPKSNKSTCSKKGGAVAVPVSSKPMQDSTYKMILDYIELVNPSEEIVKKWLSKAGVTELRSISEDQGKKLIDWFKKQEENYINACEQDHEEQLRKQWEDR